MNIPQEIGAAYDEAAQSLRTSTVGAASARRRAPIEPYRIWQTVIDEDAGVIRVVT